MSIAKGKQGYQHWCSPKDVVDALHAFAPIDLDPCSNKHSVVRASLNLPSGGLEAVWSAYKHTYVNPPYGKGQQVRWLEKAYHEYVQGARHITMLIPASVETQHWRQYVWGTASAIAFWRKRITFTRSDGVKVKGNDTPSALVYWGQEPARFATAFQAHAVCVTSWLRP